MSPKPSAPSSKTAASNRRIAWQTLVILAALLAFGPRAWAQEEPPEPPLETHTLQAQPDGILNRLRPVVEGVTTKNASAVAQALHIGEARGNASPPEALTPVGDLDGDGVPELLLNYASPDVAGLDLTPDPDSRPPWNLYLLSWDGTNWRISSLVTEVENFTSSILDLGPSTGRGLALVLLQSAPPTAYPVIFGIKDHVSRLLWDSQADASRFQPLLQGRVSFQNHSAGPAEMVVSGRTDPGFLRVAPQGRRGFEARVIYHWDGAAFIPARTEFLPGEDYTLYRFISALHLHDFRAAYALVTPRAFLNTNSPTLDAFRHAIENNWPEFLQDEVFAAPESPSGSPESHSFVLLKPDKRYVYHPAFSSDGKFLLTGLTRVHEAVPAEP